jgi:hypothetical protein
MIQNFEQFLNEDNAATPGNTPGMGNVVLPGTEGEEGSGDIFANKENRSFKKKKILNKLQDLEVNEGLYNTDFLENEFEYFIDKVKAKEMILRTFSLYDILGNSTLHKINIKDLKKN